MWAAWEPLLARLLKIVERVFELWLAFRAGRARQSQIADQDAAKVKDEQAKIAGDGPRGRDDLVRRLRDRGL
jgi:hypothetical protein